MVGVDRDEHRVTGDDRAIDIDDRAGADASHGHEEALAERNDPGEGVDVPHAEIRERGSRCNGEVGCVQSALTRTMDRVDPSVGESAVVQSSGRSRP